MALTCCDRVPDFGPFPPGPFGEPPMGPRPWQQRIRTRLCRYINTPRGCPYGPKCT
jgi:hypothetical protein